MKSDSEGLHEIANTANRDREADIVFVHGLGGSSHGTWRYSKPGQSEHFFWPEELGKDLPTCGIWSVGYPAGFTALGKPGMIIEKRAGNISQKLANYAENIGLFRTRWWSRPVPLGLVVPRASANSGIAGHTIRDVDDNHLSIVKPRNRKHDVYAGVLRFVRKALSERSTPAVDRQTQHLLPLASASQTERLGPRFPSASDSITRENLVGLQRRLREISAKDLLSDILYGRWGELELAGIVGDSSLAIPTLMDLANSPAFNSGTWARRLFAELCARIDDPADAILDVAFEGDVSWGSRKGVLPSLRFTRDPTRSRVIARLEHYAFAGTMDQKRLAVQGYGFLGNIGAVLSLSQREGVGLEKYETEKLGRFVALACLDCFTHYSESTRYFSPLFQMSQMIGALKPLGREVGQHDFLRRLQVLRPGLAPELLRYARKDLDLNQLAVVLAALDQRFTPYISDDLLEIAREFKDTECGISGFALKALSSIPGPKPLQLLHQATIEDIPRARTMWILSIGTNRSHEHKEVVLREISTGFRDDNGTRPDLRQLAVLWTAGELERAEQGTFLNELQKATTLAKAAQARAYGWLGLAKSGHSIAAKELRAAAENSTDFEERMILGIAGLFSGNPELFEGGLHAIEANNLSLWELPGHMYNDLRAGIESGLGASGRLLLNLMDRGDLD